MRGLSDSLRVQARLAGTALSLLALAAFAYIFADLVSAEDMGRMARGHWQAVVAAATLYGLAYVPMTRAWIALARGAGAQADGTTLTRIFLVSQIGKYLPGNVAQFFGRAYMARASGVPLTASGLAMALELAGVLAACSLLASVAVVFGAVSSGHSALSYVAGATAVAALAASAFIVSRRGRGARLAGPFLFAVGCYAGLLGLLAGANILLVGDMSGDWSWTMAASVAGALVVSWLVGFATPGSPAGLGLREVTFFSLLAGAYPDEAILFAAAGFRLATVAGDVIAWLVGVALPQPGRLSGARA
jgi:uncharacterized membrane protein YbhN (UPF0104 family)